MKRCPIMMAVVVAALLSLSLFSPSLIAAQQPGELSAKLFDAQKEVKAPAGMTWMACYLTLGWVGSPYGSVRVVGGPYLVERPAEYTYALQGEYVQKFSAEYLEARPREFPKHEFKDKFSQYPVYRKCMIGTLRETSLYWDEPRSRPNEALKTDFVPSFAK